MTKEIIVIKEHLKNSGGLEKQTQEIINALVLQNYKITLLCSSKIVSKQKIAIKKFSISAPFKFLKIKKFDENCQNYIKKLNNPLVLSFDRTSYQTHIRLGNGIHLAYLNQRKLYERSFKCFFNYYNPLHRTLLEIEKKGFSSPLLQKVITNSHMVKNEVLKYYSIEPSKIIVIHNGVAWKQSEPCFDIWRENKISFCEKQKLDPKKFHFLFAGNDFSRKGLKPLLFSLSLLKEDFHLSILGKDKRTNWFKNYVKKLQLEKKVTFFGQSQDIYPFYQIADALIIPSYYDPFANVTIEALAMGVQVISSKYNGGFEILNSKNGYIIDNLLDPQSLKAIIQESLKRPKTYNLAKTIRNSVKHLDFSTQMNLYLDTLTC